LIHLQLLPFFSKVAVSSPEGKTCTEFRLNIALPWRAEERRTQAELQRYEQR